MKKLCYLSLFILYSVCSFAQQQAIPVPKPHQLKWHEAEMGAVFHYDLHVFDGIRYGQGNNRINPIEDYNIFNPTELNTDQWIQAAKAAGCKFAVLTATHETDSPQICPHRYQSPETCRSPADSCFWSGSHA